MPDETGVQAPALLTLDQFGQAWKQKWPGVYDDVPDATLGAAFLDKYPQYRDQVSPFTRRGGLPSQAAVSPDFRTANERDLAGNAVVRTMNASEDEGDQLLKNARNIRDWTLNTIDTWGREGPHKVAEGLRSMAGGDRWKGARQVTEGTLVTAAPMAAWELLPALTSAPGATLWGLGAGTAAGALTDAAAVQVAQSLGLSEDQAKFVAGLAGIQAGYLGQKLTPETVLKVAEFVKHPIIGTSKAITKGVLAGVDAAVAERAAGRMPPSPPGAPAGGDTSYSDRMNALLDRLQGSPLDYSSVPSPPSAAPQRPPAPRPAVPQAQPPAPAPAPPAPAGAAEPAPPMQRWDKVGALQTLQAAADRAGYQLTDSDLKTNWQRVMQGGPAEAEAVVKRLKSAQMAEAARVAPRPGTITPREQNAGSSSAAAQAAEVPPAQPDTGTGSAGGNGVSTGSAAPGQARPAAAPVAEKLATQYNEANGRPPVQHGYATVDEERARAIGRAYEALPETDLDNPAVRSAYADFAREVRAQWDHLVAAGVKFEPWTKPGQPYANSAEMTADVRDNHHMWFFQGGDPHPLLNEVDPKTGFNVNDMFRAVHDYFGHAAGGYGFGPRGEENAWLSHAQMFTPNARRAMTTETRGQNSWVNFGEHNYNPDGTYKNIPVVDRPFAVQKAAILPDEFVFGEPAASVVHGSAVTPPVTPSQNPAADFAARFGLPSDATREARVAAKNAGKDWPAGQSVPRGTPAAAPAPAPAAPLGGPIKTWKDYTARETLITKLEGELLRAKVDPAISAETRSRMRDTIAEMKAEADRFVAAEQQKTRR